MQQMPMFTAEASLRSTRAPYRPKRDSDKRAETQSLVPQICFPICDGEDNCRTFCIPFPRLR